MVWGAIISAVGSVAASANKAKGDAASAAAMGTIRYDGWVDKSVVYEDNSVAAALIVVAGIAGVYLVRKVLE